MDIVRFDYEDTIERVTQSTHKVSQLAALEQELALYFDEEEAEAIAKSIFDRAECVWACTACGKYRDNAPQICNQCQSPTILKLECPHCKHVNISKAIKCHECDKELNPMPPLKEVEEKEEIRQNNIFLQGCKERFSSCKQNILLLIYGFINFNIGDINLYKTVAMDIIEVVILYCYNLKKLQIKDTFDDTGNINIRFSDSSHIAKLTESNISNIDSIYPVCLYGVYNVDSSAVRKLWRVKVLDHTPKDSINFSIGIEADYNMNTESRQYHVVRLNTVKIGDIISMVYSVSSDGSYATLSFAINDKRIDMSISEIQPDEIYRLMIIMRNPAELRIID